MDGNYLVRLLEHNIWANEMIIQACASLKDDRLDAEPNSATVGSIRSTLLHLVDSQRGYLAFLTLPIEVRRKNREPLAYSELRSSARASGEGLLSLARKESNQPAHAQLESRDGYLIEPWVVMVQAINHATEHREQIKSMLTALGVTPPDIDGWAYGETKHAVVPKST